MRFDQDGWHHDEHLCSFGITEAVFGVGLGSLFGGGLVGTGVADAIGGAASGALLSGVTGGNPLTGALTGGLTGGLLGGGVGSAIGDATGIGSVAGDALVGAGAGALGSGVTGQNPLTGAITGGLTGGAAGLAGVGGAGSAASPVSAGAGPGVGAGAIAAPASIGADVPVASELSSADASALGQQLNLGASGGTTSVGLALDGGAQPFATASDLSPSQLGDLYNQGGGAVPGSASPSPGGLDLSGGGGSFGAGSGSGGGSSIGANAGGSLSDGIVPAPPNNIGTTDPESGFLIGQNTGPYDFGTASNLNPTQLQQLYNQGGGAVPGSGGSLAAGAVNGLSGGPGASAASSGLGSVIGGVTPQGDLLSGAVSNGTSAASGIGSFLGKNANWLLPAGLLGYEALKSSEGLGNIPGYNQLDATASQLSAQGQQLAGYLQNGTLPPGVQQSLDQAAKQAQATIRSQYAARGMSGSSAEATDLANAQQTVNSQGTQIAMQLLQQGVNETNLSSQLYAQIMSANLQNDNQLGNALTTLAAGAARPTIAVNSAG